MQQQIEYLIHFIENAKDQEIKELLDLISPRFSSNKFVQYLRIVINKT
ncbi:hypothetical protein [Bacillus sp. 03113]|nr:hypothetical protein [Bacillus sp. 03113]